LRRTVACIERRNDRQYAAPDAAAIQLAGLAVEVGMLREQLGDARRDRDAWRDQAQ
jgi:hypothetical protein